MHQVCGVEVVALVRPLVVALGHPSERRRPVERNPSRDGPELWSLMILANAVCIGVGDRAKQDVQEDPRPAPMERRALRTAEVGDV